MATKTIQYPVNIAEPLYVELKLLAKQMRTSVSKLILNSIEEKYNLQPKVIKIVAPKSEGLPVQKGEEFDYKMKEMKEENYDKKDLYYAASRYSY